jgi:hypothetical protein
MTTVARLLVVKTNTLAASQNRCFHWGANVGRCTDEVKWHEEREAVASFKIPGRAVKRKRWWIKSNGCMVM